MDQDQGKNGNLKDLWLGIGIAMGIYVLGLLILLVLSEAFFVYLCIAAVALLLLPIISFSNGKKRLGQGALIGLGLNVLLFTACFGIIITSLGG